MLDEHMFEDIHEIAENSAYLKAVEDKVVCLDMLKQLPPYSELKEIEEALRKEGKLSFPVIFGEATGFYMIKCFLIADYAVDKALFVKDVENYRKMRFETARQKIAKVLFDRFVSTEEHQYDKGSSVFEIVQRQVDILFALYSVFYCDFLSSSNVTVANTARAVTIRTIKITKKAKNLQNRLILSKKASVL
jgi:hypothetical protein